MFRSPRLVVASLISFHISLVHGADKGPYDGLVQNEIGKKDYYNIILNGVNPKKDHEPSSRSSLNGDDLLEWSVGSDTLAATYGNAGLSNERDVWRLTEIELKKDDVSAVTTTFFKNGLRSRTECSGKTSSTLHCATASRNLCEGFKINMKKYGAKLGLTKSDNGAVSDSVKQQMINLGEQCSQYASFLENTLDPNKLMTGGSRANRDSEIVENDLQAIDNVRKAARSKPLKEASFKGLSDFYGKGNDVGASSTGMRDRSSRLKEIGADFKVMSKLAFTCSDATFIEEYAGANETVNKKPHDGSTRP